jgi:hypothetical protein
VPVVKDPENGKYNFVCDAPRIPGATLPCGWTSYWWDNADQAKARGDQHQNEHETGEPMQDQIAFELAVGFRREPENVILGPDGKRAVAVADAAFPEA